MILTECSAENAKTGATDGTDDTDLGNCEGRVSSAEAMVLWTPFRSFSPFCILTLFLFPSVPIGEICGKSPLGWQCFWLRVNSCSWAVLLRSLSLFAAIPFQVLTLEGEVHEGFLGLFRFDWI